MNDLMASYGFLPNINCPIAVSPTWTLFEFQAGDKDDSFTGDGVLVPILLNLKEGADTVTLRSIFL